jgi:hypothetical protein
VLGVCGGAGARLLDCREVRLSLNPSDNVVMRKTPPITGFVGDQDRVAAVLQSALRVEVLVGGVQLKRLSSTSGQRPFFN